MSCINSAASACLDVAKQFLPGTLTKEERIIGGAIAGFAIITTIALAILGASPLALVILGGISATILVGAAIGSRGISYCGLVVGAAFGVAAAALGYLPVGLMFVI